MDLISFVDRLLKQRPLSFLGANDQYLLPSLQHGYGGFETIGTEQEHGPLVLKDFLSYDEMRVAALISLSSWSVFVNDGRRKNFGHVDKPGTFQPYGVICGQVGARLKKEGVVEYLDCIVKKEENTVQNGFGRNNAWHVNSVWGKLWNRHLPTHDEAMQAFRNQQKKNYIYLDEEIQFEYLTLGKEFLLNVTVYKKRILITAEILLCEAASRAEAAGKNAYVHVVGLGLGVWKVSKKQEELYVEAWGDALRCLSYTDPIAHIDFSYIGDGNVTSVHGVQNGGKFPNTNITIHFSERQLHAKVPDDCILVSNYAWDSNSLPGNEYWLEKMCSTGDSAAACSSCVAEIHNHFLNPAVCSDEMRVTTEGGRVVPWHDLIKGDECSAAKKISKTIPSPLVKSLEPIPLTSSEVACKTLEPSSSLPQGIAVTHSQETARDTEPAVAFLNSVMTDLQGLKLSRTQNLLKLTSHESPSGFLDDACKLYSNEVNKSRDVSSMVRPSTTVGSMVPNLLDGLMLSNNVGKSSDTIDGPSMILRPTIVASTVPNRLRDGFLLSSEGSKSRYSDVPIMIPHPTIIGLMIPNPSYNSTPNDGETDDAE